MWQVGWIDLSHTCSVNINAGFLQIWWPTFKGLRSQHFLGVSHGDWFKNCLQERHIFTNKNWIVVQVMQLSAEFDSTCEGCKSVDCASTTSIDTFSRQCQGRISFPGSSAGSWTLSNPSIRLCPASYLDHEASQVSSPSYRRRSRAPKTANPVKYSERNL